MTQEAIKAPEELKPCPFCGSDVEMKKIPLWHGGHGYYNCYEFKVVCEKCGCTLNYEYADTIYRSEEEAISNVVKAWNGRKNEPKVGHWIKVHPIQPDDGGAFMCSCCEVGDWDLTGTENFCPECGAKMSKWQGEEK